VVRGEGARTGGKVSRWENETTPSYLEAGTDWEEGEKSRERAQGGGDGESRRGSVRVGTCREQFAGGGGFAGWKRVGLAK